MEADLLIRQLFMSTTENGNCLGDYDNDSTGFLGSVDMQDNLWDSFPCLCPISLFSDDFSHYFGLFHPPFITLTA